MPTFLKAITPRRAFADPTVIRARIASDMKQYLEDIKIQLQVYPAKGRSPLRIIHDYNPKTGAAISSRGSSRGGYTRTYKLQKGWKVAMDPSGSTGIVFNDAVSSDKRHIQYAVYVQGPRGGGRGPGQRQTAALRSKGWRSISDVARENRRKFSNIMNRSLQGAPR